MGTHQLHDHVAVPFLVIPPFAERPAQEFVPFVAGAVQTEVPEMPLPQAFSFGPHLHKVMETRDELAQSAFAAGTVDPLRVTRFR